MIHALRAAARAAVRPMVKLGTVVTVHGPNDYDIQIPGHVDANGNAVPMRHVRSTTRTDLSVGDRAYVCQVNANRPREGALWVILAHDGSAGEQAVAITFGWPMFGYDGSRTRGRDGVPPTDWAIDAGWDIPSIANGSPTISGTSLVHLTGTGDHKLRAWSLDDASQIWETDVGYPGGDFPTGVLVFNRWTGWVPGAEDLVCVNALTGEILWSRGTDRVFSSFVDIAAGSDSPLYYVRQPVIVEACSQTTGEVLWTRNIRDTFAGCTLPASGDALYASLLLAGGIVMIRVQTATGPQVVGLDPTTGDVLWTRGLKGSSDTATAIAAWLAMGDLAVSTLVTVTGSVLGAEAVAVNSDGDVVWRTPLNPWDGYGVMAAAPGGTWALVVGTFPDYDGYVGMSAISSTGAILWQRLEHYSMRPYYGYILFAGETALCVASHTSPSRILVDAYTSESSSETPHVISSVQCDLEFFSSVLDGKRLLYRDKTSGTLHRII